jgi:type II secretory pathway component PulM
MGAKTLKPAAASLYDEDFAIWTTETARLLRAGRFDEVDIEHVADEIEDMGKRDKRELHSRLTVLILHLLKWKWQPEKQTRGWQATLLTQRAELDRVLEDSPSLRRATAAAVAKVYPAVLKSAALETGLPVTAFPGECPFSPDQILDREFLPE